MEVTLNKEEQSIVDKYKKIALKNKKKSNFFFLMSLLFLGFLIFSVVDIVINNWSVEDVLKSYVMFLPLLCVVNITLFMKLRLNLDLRSKTQFELKESIQKRSDFKVDVSCFSDSIIIDAKEHIKTHTVRINV